MIEVFSFFACVAIGGALTVAVGYAAGYVHQVARERRRRRPTRSLPPRTRGGRDRRPPAVVRGRPPPAGGAH